MHTQHLQNFFLKINVKNTEVHFHLSNQLTCSSNPQSAWQIAVHLPLILKFWISAYLVFWKHSKEQYEYSMPRSYKVLLRKECCKNKAKSVSAKSVVDNVIYVAMYHVNDSKTMCTLYFFHLQFRILSIVMQRQG